MSRVGLAPRQGVALLEVEGRRLLVTYGEGGVRRLSDLDAISTVQEPATDEDAETSAPRLGLPFAAALERERASGGRMLSVLVCAVALSGGPGELVAQEHQPTVCTHV